MADLLRVLSDLLLNRLSDHCKQLARAKLRLMWKSIIWLLERFALSAFIRDARRLGMQTAGAGAPVHLDHSGYCASS